MTDGICFIVPGKPIGKGRARSFMYKSKRTGKLAIGHHTPEQTRTWEGIAKSLAIDAMNGRIPLDGPVELKLDILFDIPSGWPEWKKELARGGCLYPTVKPDKDNIEKAVKDALNGVVWKDDCQVVFGSQMKRYGVAAGVLIQVKPVPGYAAQQKTKPRG